MLVRTSDEYISPGPLRVRQSPEQKQHNTDTRSFEHYMFSLPGIHQTYEAIKFWMLGEEIRFPANWLIPKYYDGLEAPDNSRGCPVIVLVGARIMTVHVVALQAPGKVLEGKFVVCSTADVDGRGVVDEAVGVHVPNAAHAVYEGPPFSDRDGEPRASENVGLLPPASIEAAPIEDQPGHAETSTWQPL